MCQHNWADACTPVAWPGTTRKPHLHAGSIRCRHAHGRNPVLAHSCEQTELEQILSRDVCKVGGCRGKFFCAVNCPMFTWPGFLKEACEAHVDTSVDTQGTCECAQGAMCTLRHWVCTHFHTSQAMGLDLSAEGAQGAASSLGRTRMSLEGLGHAPPTSDLPSSPFTVTQALVVRAASQPHQSRSGKIRTNTQVQKKGGGRAKPTRQAGGCGGGSHLPRLLSLLQRQPEQGGPVPISLKMGPQ